MSTALVRVSVVAGRRRLDLAVPPTLSVAELVPGLARGLGVVSYDGLRLCTATGAVLDDATGLAPQGVPDGAVLTLATVPPPPVVHDDPAEVLAEGPVEVPVEVPAEVPAGGATSGRPPRWLPAAAASPLLLLGLAAVAVAGRAREAAVVALLLLAGGLALGRVAPARAVVACAAASGYAAAAAWTLAAALRPGPGVRWAAAGGAALAVASLAMAVLPTHRLRLLPVVVLASAAALVGAVGSVRPLPWPALASMLLVGDVLLAAGVPWLAVGRVPRPSGRVDVDRLATGAALARELTATLTLGLGLVQVALTPVVASSGPAGVALAGCAGCCTLLRARYDRSPRGWLPGAGSGAAALLLTAAAALWRQEPWRPVGALVLAGAGGVLLLAGAPPPGDAGDAPTTGVLARTVLRALEAVVLAALLPLLVVATGVLGTVP